MKRTIAIDEARKMARTSGLNALSDAIEKAAGDGWDLVNLEAIPDGDGGYDIVLSEPDGVMVAWMLPDYLATSVAIPGGEPRSSLHVTLAYLGDAAAMPVDTQRKLIGVVSEVALESQGVEGTIGGLGRFRNGEDKDPLWIGVQIPGLAELRAKLVTALTDAGIPPVGLGVTDYKPHVTVAYVGADTPDPELDFAPMPASVYRLTVCIGPKRFPIDLQSNTEFGGPEYADGGWRPSAITKALDTVEEERYTLGPWYIPDQLDAHGEWTDRRELQKSFHSYLAKDDRDIRLQHNTDIIAGRWVDGMVMPEPWTVTLKSADGTEEQHTYPAGTPFLGVRWEPWAFKLVKDGKIRGYSIGGRSLRMMVDLPTGESDEA
jgi:hypothetical protein